MNGSSLPPDSEGGEPSGPAVRFGASRGRETGFSSGRETGFSSGRETGFSSGRETGAAHLVELIALCSRGHEEAFAELYDRTSQRVYGMILRVLRSPDHAAEVMQEVYVEVWRQSARYSRDKGSVIAWMTTMAHRRAVDRVRSVSSEVARDERYAFHGGDREIDQVWDGVEQRLDVEWVRRGMASLTPIQREALMLPPPSAPAEPPIDELALRRQQRRTRMLSVLVAAVVAAALALGGVVYGLVQARQAQVARQAAETELLTAPDVKTYTATMKDGGQVSFVVSRSLNRAMFVGKDLPAVGADRTYQLWTLEGQRAIPDNTVPGGGDRKEFFRETLGGVTGLAVSVEAAGGAQQPNPSTIQVITELAA